MARSSLIGGPSGVPSGFAVRTVPASAPGMQTAGWRDVFALDGGRVGVSLGHCITKGLAADTLRAADLGAAIRTALQGTADPDRALHDMALTDTAHQVSAAVCAVIDSGAAQLVYRSLGDGALMVASPDVPGRLLDQAGPGAVTLPPGSTLLAHTGGRQRLDIGLLDHCATLHPEHAADEVLAGLEQTHPACGLELLLYRQRPDDLIVTVPAEPASLAVVRGQLRRWLAVAGVDPEVSADTLLAVGEAASNAAEHAVLGVGHAVEITVRASISDGRLRFGVSDNGRWKPAPEFPGHRGHGLPLIRALVDAADLTSTSNGTTVEMLKELPQ